MVTCEYVAYYAILMNAGTILTNDKLLTVADESWVGWLRSSGLHNNQKSERGYGIDPIHKRFVDG